MEQKLTTVGVKIYLCEPFLSENFGFGYRLFWSISIFLEEQSSLKRVPFCEALSPQRNMSIDLAFCVSCKCTSIRLQICVLGYLAVTSVNIKGSEVPLSINKRSDNGKVTQGKELASNM